MTCSHNSIAKNPFVLLVALIASLLFGYSSASATSTSLTVYAVDQSGAAMPNDYFNIFCDSPEYDAYGYTSVSNSSQGTVAIDISTTKIIGCYISGYSGYGTVSKGTVTLVPGVSNSVNVTLKPLDATVTLEVRDTSGNLLPVSSATSFNCTATNDIFYSGTIGISQSSGNVSVLGGYTYSCSIPFPGITGYSTPTSSQVSVAVGATQTITITATVFDATLRVNFVDANGSAVSAPSGVSGYCYSTTQNLSFSFDYITIGDTQALAQVVSGLTYNCYISGFTGYSNSASVEMIAVSGQTVAKNLTLYALDGTLTAHLTLGGNAFSGQPATVSCNSAAPEHSVSGSFSTGSDISFSIIKGATYTCSATLSSYITTGYPEIAVPFSATGPVILDIPLLALDTSVTFSFKDKNGNLVPAPSGAWLSCYETGSYIFSRYLPIGYADTSLSTTLVGGYDYNCSLSNFTNYTSINKVIEPSSGGTIGVDLILQSLDSAIQFNYVSPNGSPITIPAGNSYAAISCTSSTDFSSFFSTTIDSGVTSTVLPLVGAQQYECSVYGINGYGIQSLEPITVTANQTKQTNVVLKALDATLSFNFVNSVGTAVGIPSSAEYPAISCYSTNDFYTGFYKQVNSGDTSTAVPVLAGTYSCSLYGVTGYSVSSDVTGTVAASGTTSLNFVLTPLDATITVNLVDNNGSPFQVTSSMYAGVNCYSSDYINNFYANATGSSASVSVLGGKQYRCGIYLADYATTTADVSVGASATASATVQVLSRTATATVQFKDNTGAAVVLDAILSAYSLDNSFQDYLSNAISGSSASVSLVPDKAYGLSVSFNAAEGSQVYGAFQLSDGSNYLLPQSGLTVTALSGQTVTKEVVLTKADSTISVSVDDPAIASTDASDFLWVSAAAYMSDGLTIDPDSYIGANVARDGTVTLPSLSGKKYLIQVFADDSIAPAPQSVTVTSPGETKSVTFTLVTTTFNLTTSVTGASGDGSYSCWAYDADGRFSFSSVGLFSETTTLPLAAGSWSIGCNGFSVASDGKSYYSDIQSYTVATGQSAGTLAITLKEGDALFNFQETIATGASTKLTVGENISVDVYAGAFNETAVLSVSNQDATPNLGDVEVIRGTGCTIKANDLNAGDLVLQNGEITVRVTIDESQLPAGATFDDISAAQYSPGSGWTTLPSTNDGTTTSGVGANASISRGFQIALRQLKKPISLVRRGVRAATIAPLPAAPGAVTKLKATIKKPKRIRNRATAKAQVTVSWKAATGTVDNYTVALKVSKKKTITKSVSGTLKKAVFKNLKAGTYTVTVTATNTGGSGSAVKKKFKVKF